MQEKNERGMKKIPAVGICRRRTKMVAGREIMFLTMRILDAFVSCAISCNSKRRPFCKSACVAALFITGGEYPTSFAQFFSIRPFVNPSLLHLATQLLPEPAPEGHRRRPRTSPRLKSMGPCHTPRAPGSFAARSHFNNQTTQQLT